MQLESLQTYRQALHAHRAPTLSQAQAETNYAYGEDLRPLGMAPNPTATLGLHTCQASIRVAVSQASPSGNPLLTPRGTWDQEALQREGQENISTAWEAQVQNRSQGLEETQSCRSCYRQHPLQEHSGGPRGFP